MTRKDPTEAFASLPLARAFFEQSPFSMVIYDAEGHVIAVNAAFEELWNVGLVDVPAAYTVLTDPLLERAGFLPTIRRAFEGERVTTPPVKYDIAAVATQSAGRTVWTEGHFYPVFDSAGRVTHVVLVHVDLTERVAIEEALRASERRMAAMFEQATVGIAQTDNAGRFLHVNERFARIVGRTCDELLTLDVSDVTHPEDRQRTTDLIGGAVIAGDAFAIEKRYLRPDGEIAWVRNSVTPVRDEDGHITGVVAVVIDITEQRRANDRVRQSLEAERTARAAAEEANHAKMQFLATMSHELRTPLNAIGGYTELIEAGIHGPTTAEQREALARIRRSQRALLALINDVLNFARLEAGQLELDVCSVPVDEVLGGLENLVAPQLRMKGLDYHYASPPADCRVRADPDRLQQIMLNLLSNAIKFTAAAGRIEVSVACLPTRVDIQVRDTGIGIPAEDLQRIFDPFVQPHRSLTHHVEGTGLGLAISRDLARTMGGEIGVTSRPGFGSTFTLTLPRDAD